MQKRLKQPPHNNFDDTLADGNNTTVGFKRNNNNTSNNKLKSSSFLKNEYGGDGGKTKSIPSEKKGNLGGFTNVASPSVSGDTKRSSKSPQTFGTGTTTTEEDPFKKTTTALSPIRKKDVSFFSNNENLSNSSGTKRLSTAAAAAEQYNEPENLSSLTSKRRSLNLSKIQATDSTKSSENDSSLVVLTSQRSSINGPMMTKNSYVDNALPIALETLSNSGRFTLLKLEPRKTATYSNQSKLETYDYGDLKKTPLSADLNSSNLMDKINLNSTLTQAPCNPLSRDSLRNLFSHTLSLTNHLEGKISPSVNGTQINDKFIEASMNSAKWSTESKKFREKPVGTKFGERYEFDSMDSLMLNESPPPTNSGSLIAFPSKRKLCLFGGSTNDGPSNETWLFEVGLQKWMKVMIDPLHNQSVPERRFGHCASVFDSNTMCIFGGGDTDSRVLFNDLWIFKPDPFPVWKRLSIKSSTTNMLNGQPSPRMHAICAVKDDFLFVHGGEGSNFMALDDLFVYSRSQNMWIPLTPVMPKPSPRFLHTACVVDSKIIIIGGMNGSEEIEDPIWSFDTRSFFWQEIKIPKNQGPFKDGSLYGHTATVWGNRIMVFGGLRGRTRKINYRVWLLDLLANVWIDISEEWNSTTDLPTNCYKHMAASDFYSHISCNTYRPLEKQNLSSLAKHQVSKYLHEQAKTGGGAGGSDTTILQMPADISLQKLTKTYFFGGTQSTKRSNELWELSLVFKQHQKR